MRGLEKNNKGYSLVELIVVIAIISVVGLGLVMSVALIFSANAKTCANDIVGAIAECKIMTMTKAKGNVRVIIYRDGADGAIVSELQTRETTSSAWETGEDGMEKIGAKRCSVGTSDGADNIPTSRDLAWKFYFDRSSGALLTEGVDVTGADEIVEEIYVVGGSKHYRIQIAKLTGKVTKELLSSG